MAMKEQNPMENEPVAWTTPAQLLSMKAGAVSAHSMWPTPHGNWPIPLFASPPASSSPAVKALRELIADCRYHLTKYRPGPLARAEEFLAGVEALPSQSGLEETENTRLREALKAIAEGYAITVHDDRYITVDNPRYQPDNGSAPKLVIDTAALTEKEQGA